MGPGFFGFFGRDYRSFCHHGDRDRGACGTQMMGGFRNHLGGGRGPWHGGAMGGGGDFDDGGFGVRRPLRFLAWKLELEEEQIPKLAVILDELKIERAQASVDHRRSVAALAEAMGSVTFDAAKAKEAGDGRVKSAERLREAVTQALSKIHALLDEEQRRKFAYLLQAGALNL